MLFSIRDLNILKNDFKEKCCCTVVFMIDRRQSFSERQLVYHLCQRTFIALCIIRSCHTYWCYKSLLLRINISNYVTCSMIILLCTVNILKLSIVFLMLELNPFWNPILVFIAVHPPPTALRLFRVRVRLSQIYK